MWIQCLCGNECERPAAENLTPCCHDCRSRRDRVTVVRIVHDAIDRSYRLNGLAAVRRFSDLHLANSVCDELSLHTDLCDAGWINGTREFAGDGWAVRVEYGFEPDECPETMRA